MQPACFVRQKSVFGIQVLGQKKVLGDRHPDTLTAMSNLAYTLSELGDTVAALSLVGQLAALDDEGTDEGTDDDSINLSATAAGSPPDRVP
jgi:hypothetical protein